MVIVPLQLWDFTSWDQLPLGEVDNRYAHHTNFSKWSGSVTSLVTGYDGAGKAINQPTNFRRFLYRDSSTDKDGGYDTFYIRFRLRHNSTSGSTIFSLVAKNDGLPGLDDVFRLNWASPVGLAVVAGTTYSAQLGLGTSTWYAIEVAVHLHDSNGKFEVRVDGVPVAALTQSGIDTRRFSATASTLANDILAYLNFNNSFASYDECIIKLGYGGYGDQDFMGRLDSYPKIITLYPDSNNLQTPASSWTVTGAGSAFLAISEATADQSSYIQNNSGTHNVFETTMSDNPFGSSDLFTGNNITAETPAGQPTIIRYRQPGTGQPGPGRLTDLVIGEIVKVSGLPMVGVSPLTPTTGLKLVSFSTNQVVIDNNGSSLTGQVWAGSRITINGLDFFSTNAFASASGNQITLNVLPATTGMGLVAGQTVNITGPGNGDFEVLTTWYDSGGDFYYATVQGLVNTIATNNGNAIQFEQETQNDDVSLVHAIKTCLYMQGDSSTLKACVRTSMGLGGLDGVEGRAPYPGEELDAATTPELSLSWRLHESLWLWNWRAARPFIGGDVASMTIRVANTNQGNELPNIVGQVRVSQITAEVLYDPPKDEIVYSGKDIPDTTTHRRASCYRITRTDGTVFRFTTSDVALLIENQETQKDEWFLPVGAADISAESREAALADRNKSFMGAFNADAITNEDMRKGLYRDAEIEEFYVDWRYPWRGRYNFNRYWIADYRWSGDHWDINVSGLGRFFKARIGDVFTRDCRFNLGGPGCRLNLENRVARGVQVTNVLIANRKFKCKLAMDEISAKSNNWYQYGMVYWRSGGNAGLICAVKNHQWNSGEGLHVLEVELPLPANIQVGDAFDLVPGCALTLSACTFKWLNHFNFGGFPWLPGTDKALQSPDL